MSKDADRRVGKRAWGQMILTLALVSAVTSLWGQGHDSGFNAHWVGPATGQGDQQVNAVAVDMFGQVHSAGYFTGATAFGGLSVTNAGQFDFFALRHSRAGDLLWARSGGGPGQDACLAVAADAEGNTLAAGYFSAGARFDGQLLSHVGSADAVILKLNPAGAVIWIKVMGGPGDDRAYGISVAGDGSIYVAGHAQAGATIDSRTVGNAGGADAFLLKLASDGTPVWVRNGGGPAGEVAWSVAAVPAGGAVISGYADDQARFGDQVVSSFGNVDFFAASYDSSGNLRWVRSGGGTGQDNGYAVAATHQGSVWLAGSIRGEARFGEIVMSGTGQRALVSRIEPDGSVAWARTLPGTEARGLAADAEGVLVTGHFLGRATFGTHLLENQGNLDVFLARLETTGAVSWARSFGGPGSDQGFAINAHPEHGLGLAGRFSLTVDFDQRDVTSLGGGDGFVTKLSRAPVFVTLPEGRTVGPGVDVSLFGQAMGASPLHYQWFFNESEPVAGATENQLDLGAVDFDQKGLYSLEVSNAFGRAISPPVFLNVFGLAKPRIRINGASGGAFDLTNAAAVTLELSHELIDARLYYTLDGSEPSSGSLRYSAPITLSTTAVIRAIAYDQALASSQTAAIP
ncbi:MAG: hypothetical protein FJ405_04265, partial [Verrucomicrobia bacterium]|nr:hypothetical protein [Verrucomicrobiota bacterium]